MGDTPSRKLAVILHADVVGSTALVKLNETLAHERIQDTFRRLSETISRHGGIAREIRGDALVAEFAKASDAVGASLAFQAANTTHNEELSDDVRPVIRVGIAMGEVVVADNTVTGEGVVLAQRLEQLAEPGGVCLQGAVYETVPKRLPFEYENLGERELKGFEEPVRVYAVRPGLEVAIPESATPTPLDAALGLPDKPSIAVLPFTNMSNDPEQEFFADGITEDIITELSREKDLFVIARNSTFAYKGQTPDIKQVAKELGVKYVLEGSMRKSGNKIRLNAQLIEGETNRHIWAERYDRALEDIFEVQDDLTNTIMNTLLQKIQGTSMDRALRRPPRNLAAFDHYTRGFGLLLRLNKRDNEEAMREAHKALEIDPNHARAHMLLSWAHLYSMWTRWVEDPGAALKQGHERALKAIACDKDDFWGYGALSFAELFMENHDRALTAIDQAVALNPNSADTHAMRAIILNYTGNPEEGLKEVELAIRHNPYHPYWYLIGAGRALFLLERYDEALPYLERLINAGEDVTSWRSLLAATYVGLGRQQEARKEITKAIEADPNLTVTEILSLLPMKDKEAIERYADLLRQAGLPE